MGIFLMLLVLSFIAVGIFRSIPITKTVYDAKLRTVDGHKFGFAPLKSLPFLGLAIATFVLFLSFVTVDAGSVGIVKKFGQPVGQLSPGAHLILPYEDVTPVAVQTRIVHPNTQSSSLDLQVVHTEVTLQYHVDPAYATFVLVELNNDAEARIIDPAILESIKAVTAKYDAQQLIAQRVSVRDGIENLVRQKLSTYHIIAENVSITNFNFSDEYNKAIEAKVTAQQHSEQATNDLKRIQIEAEQKVAAAKGEAEALRSQKEQITPELLQLRTIEMMDKKWDGKLPESWVTTGSGQSPLPMFDVFKGKK